MKPSLLILFIALVFGATRCHAQLTGGTITGGQSAETWVIEGDSWSANGIPGEETWSQYIPDLIGPRVRIVNAATAGTTAQTMVGQFATQCAPYLTAARGNPSTCFIFAGINDAATRTTAQLRTDLQSLWTAARNAGARVVAFTLPYRTASGGWSQSDWATINANIRADSSYWDVLIETDVFHSTNKGSSDQLHLDTADYRILAGQVMLGLSGQRTMPNYWPDFVCYSVGSLTFTGGTRRNMPFGELYDANDDGNTATVGSDANTSVFTAPVNGTYEIYSNVGVSGLASGDSVYTNAWITPISTGTEVEHRLDYQIAAGSVITTKGQVRRRLNRGDKVSIAIVSSKTASAPFTNNNFSAFQVRLVSIP